MKIGILNTDTVKPDWAVKFGNYPTQFTALLSEVDPSLEFVTYEVQEGEYPADIDEVDAYLITGSKISVYEDREWIRQLMEFVRKLDAAKNKLLGICFGHQLIAHALGGKTAKSDKGWGVGVHHYPMIDSPAVPMQTMSVVVSHQDQVVETATGAKVLGGTDFCPNAVCQIGDHILTFQGHPEFVADYSRTIIEFRREMIGEDVAQAGLESLSDPLDRQAMARWMLDFIAP
ncbi:MAG: amidotransferase [Pseudomonadales bacterium]